MVWVAFGIAIILIYLYTTGRRAKALESRQAPPPPRTTSIAWTSTTHASRETIEAEAAAFEPKRQRRRSAAALPIGAEMKKASVNELQQYLGADESEIRQLEHEDSKALKRDTYLLTLASGQKIVVRHTPGYDWIDVITSGKRTDYSRIGIGDLQRYGFSVQMSRWSFGEGPHGAREIRSALRTLEPTIQGRERW